MKGQPPSFLRPAQPATTGFTLTEVLVAIALLGIVMSLSAGIMTSMQANTHTGTQLSVTQAAGSWMESASNLWNPDANFGNLALLPDVTELSKYTWSLSVCTVNAQSGATTCGAAVTTGKPRYADGTSVTTAGLVRVNLTYTPTSGGSARTTSLELSK